MGETGRPASALPPPPGRRTLIRVTVDQIPCAPSPSGSARGPSARRGEREGGQEEVTRAERREVRRLARSCREPRAEGGETWTLLPGRGPSARAGGPAWGRCESAGRESDSERLGLGCGWLGSALGSGGERDWRGWGKEA